MEELKTPMEVVATIIAWLTGKKLVVLARDKLLGDLEARVDKLEQRLDKPD